MEFNAEETEELIENAGVCQNTLAAKRRAEKHFESFLKLKNEIIDVVHDEKKLQPLLIEYFSTYRLDNNELPKMSTLDATRSHVKMMIKKMSKLDINDSAIFCDFDRFWKGLRKRLKQEGKADIAHNEVIADSQFERIYQLLGILTDIMELDEEDEGYETALLEIPEEYREKYHYLVMYGAIVIFILQVST